MPIAMFEIEDNKDIVTINLKMATDRRQEFWNVKPIFWNVMFK